MTGITPEIAQGNAVLGSVVPEFTTVGFDLVLSPDDPESLSHQSLAAVLHCLKTGGSDPRWADLPRKDRVTYYSLTDGLV